MGAPHRKTQSTTMVSWRKVSDVKQPSEDPSSHHSPVPCAHLEFSPRCYLLPWQWLEAIWGLHVPTDLRGSCQQCKARPTLSSPHSHSFLPSTIDHNAENRRQTGSAKSASTQKPRTRPEGCCSRNMGHRDWLKQYCPYLTWPCARGRSPSARSPVRSRPPTIIAA